MMDTDESEDLQGLFLEDWDGIFDEAPHGGRGGGDAGSDGGGPDDEEEDLMGMGAFDDDEDEGDDHHDDNDNANNASVAGGDESADKAGVEASSKGTEAGKNAKTKDKDAKKRRSSKAIENAARTAHVRPPSWHSEAADRPHRQAMILEVARLLQIRKKTQPSKEWLQQLPHKARKLEERLYRNATSLEAYLDRATLKIRLKKLARIITKQFLDTKSVRTRAPQHFRQLQASDTTNSTAARVSFASSIASSQDSRDSIMSRNSMLSSTSMESLRRNLRDATMNRSSVLSTTASELGSDEQRRKSSVLGGPASAALQSMALLSTGGGGMNNGSGAVPVAPAPGTGSQGHSPTSMSVGQGQGQQQPGGGGGGGAGANNNNNYDDPQKRGPFGVAELERQKAVNAQLEKQIMDNIRQQEDMVRQMQGRGGGVGQGQQQQLQQSQPGLDVTGAATANSAAALTSALQAAATARNQQLSGNSLGVASANQLGNANFLASQNSFFNPAAGLMSMGPNAGGFQPALNNQMMQFMQQQPNAFGQQLQQQPSWGSLLQGFGQNMMNNNNGNPNNNNCMSNIMSCNNTILPVPGTVAPMSSPGLSMVMPPPPNPQQQQPPTALSRQHSAGGGSVTSSMNGSNNNNSMMGCGPNGGPLVAGPGGTAQMLGGPNLLTNMNRTGNGNVQGNGPPLSPSSFHW